MRMPRTRRPSPRLWAISVSSIRCMVHSNCQPDGVERFVSQRTALTHRNATRIGEASRTPWRSRYRRVAFGSIVGLPARRPPTCRCTLGARATTLAHHDEVLRIRIRVRICSRVGYVERTRRRCAPGKLQSCRPALSCRRADVRSIRHVHGVDVLSLVSVRRRSEDRRLPLQQVCRASPGASHGDRPLPSRLDNGGCVVREGRMLGGTCSRRLAWRSRRRGPRRCRLRDASRPSA
jgi:hypothetical protein